MFKITRRPTTADGALYECFACESPRAARRNAKYYKTWPSLHVKIEPITFKVDGLEIKQWWVVVRRKGN